jgi:hypothetical protein
MQATTCPICHEFVGHIPDGWLSHVVHRPSGGHSLTTVRPDFLCPTSPNSD